MKRVLIATLVTAALAAGVPVVMAQTAKPGVEAPAAQRPAPRQHEFRSPSERVEARLAYIKTALKITSAQEAQWNSFANVLRSQAREMDKRFQERRAQFAQRAPGAQRPDRPNITAIERLERTQQRMTARAARLNDVLTAAKPLYAALSPEQKQVADQMLAKAERGRFQHRRGGHGMA
jgi:protein CpxP